MGHNYQPTIDGSGQEKKGTNCCRLSETRISKQENAMKKVHETRHRMLAKSQIDLTQLIRLPLNLGR
jgi:hypothetical protein